MLDLNTERTVGRKNIQISLISVQRFNRKRHSDRVNFRNYNIKYRLYSQVNVLFRSLYNFTPETQNLFELFAQD